MFDSGAEQRLGAALRAAYSDTNTNGGRYLCFPVLGVRANDESLLAYCDEWLPVARTRFDTTGYRPLLLCEEDRSMIGLNSGGGSLYVQGRMEAVVILAPVAASFALGISPSVAKWLPSTRYFWDGLEKYDRLPCRRPPTTLPDTVGGKHEVWEIACQDLSAKTSDNILNYFALIADRTSAAWKQHCRKIWPDSAESKYLDAQRDLQLRPLDRYLNVSLAEAEKLIADKSQAMIASRTNSWCGTDMTYPNRIHVGEFIFYFTTIWPDCVLFKGGTRWRPREGGYEKGAVYLSSSEDKASSGCVSLACIGKASLLHAWIPLMAACSLLIDPCIASQTKAFAPFWDSVGSSYESRKRLPNPYKAGMFVSDRFVGKSEWEHDSDMFQFENELCAKQFYINLHLLTHTNGFWAGGYALNGVSLSRTDFVDWACLWEPDALVESVGRFRVRPAYLEKGGIGIEKGGAYFSIQTSNDPALSMLVMLSAVQAGVPPAIAALCPFADPFWDFASARTSKDQVLRRRAYLRELRTFQMANSRSTAVVSPVEVSRVASWVNAKLHTFELCEYRSLVVHFETPTDGRVVSELELRIKEAGGGLATEDMEEVRGDQILTMVPIQGNYQVQLKLSPTLALSVAVRIMPQRVPDWETLRNLLVAVFMVKQPDEALTQVRELVYSKIGRDRKR